MVSMTTRDWPEAVIAPTGGQGLVEAKYPQLTRLALLLVWLEGALSAFQGVKLSIQGGYVGMDAHAYWVVSQGELVYNRAPGQIDAYLYSPAFATAIWPLARLAWPVFLTVWVCFEATALVWLLKPLKARWSIPLCLLCVPELVLGNIYLLLAAAAVVGLRRPAIWALPILTKITPGVGLLWFAFRGNWRRLAQGAGVTMAIVCVSFAFGPARWHEWLVFLSNHRGGAPDGGLGFALRCLLAVALVALGARTQRPWLIAPAMVLASPALAVPTLTLLAAVPRLLMPSAHDGEPAGSSGPEPGFHRGSIFGW
jgi:hypothetical protein